MLTSFQKSVWPYDRNAVKSWSSRRRFFASDLREVATGSVNDSRTRVQSSGENQGMAATRLAASALSCSFRVAVPTKLTKAEACNTENVLWLGVPSWSDSTKRAAPARTLTSLKVAAAIASGKAR